MANPWLSIPLQDYEGHMGLDNAQQLSVLSELFKRALDIFVPDSVAVLGIAGGNGLDGPCRHSQRAGAETRAREETMTERSRSACHHISRVAHSSVTSRTSVHPGARKIAPARA
jgi:hypothetical protein